MTIEISAILPTKNRHNDLFKAVQSICMQTVLPNELVIIDQSKNNYSEKTIANLLSGYRGMKLKYTYDPTISGLIPAKNYGVQKSSCEIICFLEDDVILDKDFFFYLKKSFSDHSDIVGCSGIITNPMNPSIWYKLWFNFFHRGIYFDPRVSIYGKIFPSNYPLIKSNFLSGGLTAWRRKVFEMVKFDMTNQFFMLEDIDFSTRVESHFGQHLYINTSAKLEHHWSLVNRDLVGVRYRKKTFEIILFYKKRKKNKHALKSLCWLLVGIMIQSVIACIFSRSLKPISGYVIGLADGFFTPIKN